MKALFNQLFDYNFYCNRKLIEECAAMKKVPEKSATLFNHILNTHHIWNHRLLKKPHEFGVWQEHSMTDWQDIHYDNQRTSFEIITNTEDFEKRVEYETTEGRTFANDLKDILFHIVNHSTHHRGQMLMDFRANNIEPKALDYIFYRR
ncbi:DinB family protein [Allomuricauda sp. SCSIO 65647]|uniref:DinB family protein n=1 Tax=Allomuricauda sp. SCSIO 65647 TaxID=2908843 RepID=UPI001F31F230|nr:DinB family protein [Muricauda sp. SCSIO 65647]UJH68874.1 damage-inducible protein DinB [Muricauda sp. SCSIO 65647]